jgi:hypothetical protein
MGQVYSSRNTFHRVIATVTAISVLASTSSTLANGAGAFGPCVETVPAAVYSTFTRCENGSCPGQLTVVHMQSACANQDESPCVASSFPSMTIVDAKANDLGWATFLKCIAPAGATCVACVAGAAALCSNPVSWWVCAIGAGGCGAVCFSAGIFDPCCWIDCILDLSTMRDIPGGRQC